MCNSITLGSSTGSCLKCLWVPAWPLASWSILRVRRNEGTTLPVHAGKLRVWGGTMPGDRRQTHWLPYSGENKFYIACCKVETDTDFLNSPLYPAPSIIPLILPPFASPSCTVASIPFWGGPARLVIVLPPPPPQPLSLYSPQKPFWAAPKRPSPTLLSSTNSGRRQTPWFVWALVQFAKGCNFVGVETVR